MTKICTTVLFAVYRIVYHCIMQCYATRIQPHSGPTTCLFYAYHIQYVKLIVCEISGLSHICWPGRVVALVKVTIENSQKHLQQVKRYVMYV